MKKLYFTLTLVTFLVSCGLYAQEREISGRIRAYGDLYVKDAKVISKKTGNSSITDSLGFFKLKCAVNDKLVVKAPGFKTRKFATTKSDTMNIYLIFWSERASVKHSTGYDKRADDDLTETIHTMENEKRSFRYYTTVGEMIMGRFPGVKVNADGSIFMRGISSLRLDNAALILVDGVPVETTIFLNPSDIKSINILKGSSAAIYGSRGANGVVIIETGR